MERTARRRTRARALVLVLAVAALVLPAPVADATTPGAALGPEDLELLEIRVLSPRLRELVFRTPAAPATTPVRILLPDGFDGSGRTRYPVLYLLHGGTGSARDWTEQGDAEAITAGAPLIVVMPDVTGYGNYVDWYNAGRGGPPMWETYVIRQLLPWVDEHLPTVGARHGRAVAGLSMGGGGAMGYAARHPDLFVAAAAFSGAVDTNTVPVQLLASTSGMQDGHEPGAVFGHRLTDEVRWRGHNPWDLAANLRHTAVELHTGNGLPGGPGGDVGDPIEQQCHEMMTNLHERLTGFGIPHLWNDYGPGGHTWFYWRRDLTELLPRLLTVLAERRPDPARFDFTAIESSFEVYGWSVQIDRPHVEFATLTGAGRDGFALHGTGDADVATGPLYRPGQRLLVEVVDPGGRRSEVVPAGDDGRLRVHVSLGPANPYQQHTVEGRLWALGQPGGDWPVRTATVAVRPA